MKDKNNNLFFKNEQSDYLSSSKYIDCNNTQIINKANETTFLTCHHHLKLVN